jgi:hypothetical protein
MRDMKHKHLGIVRLNEELTFLCNTYGIPRQIFKERGHTYRWEEPSKSIFNTTKVDLCEELGWGVADNILDRVQDIVRSIRNYRDDVREFFDRFQRPLRDRAEMVRGRAAQKINAGYSKASSRKVDVVAEVCWPRDMQATDGVIDLTKCWGDKWRVKLGLTVMQAMRISSHNIAFVFKGRPFYSLEQESMQSEYLSGKDLLGYKLTGVSKLEGNTLKRLIADTKAEVRDMLECGDELSAEYLDDLVRQYENAQYSGAPVKFTAYVVRSKYACYSGTELPISGEGFTLVEAMNLFKRRVKQETFKAL